MHMNPDEWLDVVRREYMQEFIRAGGAAVKVAVPFGDDAKADLSEGLRRLATAEDFAFVLIDAARTKAHMVDHIFHEVARQVDWDDLAYRFVSRLIAQNGLRLPDERASFSLRRIAELNERQEMLLRADVTKWLERAIFRDYQMTQEFRIAMIRLCMAQLDPEDVQPFLTSAVKEWLRGELRLISALKQATIFQKVARHNARHLLFSFAHWLRLCGRGGLILAIDISRYTDARRSETDGVLNYSIPAVMDGYEVLRQFVDGTDELEACLIVVITAQEFLTDSRRGLECYDALRLRIADEVRDRTRANPLASLVRIATGSGA